MGLEDLEAYGMARMDETEIRQFLSNQRVGVLGLPTDGAPYLVPLSFGFDGDSRLYFAYVGSESRKGRLSDRAEIASVLVYSADSPFNWESVLLEGGIERVPDDEVDDLVEVLDTAWRPELFERAETGVENAVYRFVIDERVGIKHTGHPPAFER